ncbi:hypothetical protein [Neisseria mucosa]|uniref:hypothetical protein n=1 Tax=Neisseria mucosa TaxID=488 RepID=UPI00076AB574|nr:hypothetical protein [Neisseria mucosa]
MIGILLLILHITVFVSIGFVLGAIFEWQNTKWNILHSNKKRKIFYILGMVIGFVLMFGDELIGEIQMKNICNSNKMVFVFPIEDFKHKDLIELDSKYLKLKGSAVPVRYYVRKYGGDDKKIYIISKSYMASGGWVSRLNDSVIGSSIGPMWISDWNKHCNSMDYKRLKDLYDVKIINLNN